MVAEVHTKENNFLRAFMFGVVCCCVVVYVACVVFEMFCVVICATHTKSYTKPHSYVCLYFIPLYLVRLLQNMKPR